MKKALSGILVSLLLVGAIYAGEKTKVIVNKVMLESSADKAGIKIGDILISYDGKAVHSSMELQRFKGEVTTDSVEMVILRGEKELKLKIPKGQIGVYLKEREPEIELKEDAVVIKGVERLGWDLGMSNSFIASLMRIANSQGIDVDYTYLMGISGTGFRAHFHKDWCPSSPDPTCGYNCGEEAIKALGYTSKTYMLKKEKPDTERIRKAIVKSIDKGIPILAIDLIEIPEWGIITGYQNGGKEFLCRTYFDKVEGYNLAQKFPWVVITLNKKGKRPSDMENYKNSLKLALKLCKTKMFGDYYSGTAALKDWMEKLKNLNVDNLKDEQFQNVCLANAWIFGRLIEDRDYAVKYLERIADELGELKSELKELTEVYKREIEILTQEKGIAPYPFTIKDRSEWTQGMRDKEIEILKQALMQEEKAQKLLEKVNALW